MSLRNKLKSAYGKVQRKILGFFPNSSFYGAKIIPALWKIARLSESKFWESWVKNIPKQDPDFFQSQISPDKALFPFLHELINTDDGEIVKIIDVGAGPISVLGDKWEGRSVQITAVDPLANEYNKALKNNGIKPHIVTQYAEAERLSNFYQDNSFDLAYASNSIDHCYDPVKAIEEMLKLIKPGAYLYMQHYINEAENENYAGMHQWNFNLEANDFIISNLRKRININSHLKGIAEIKCELSENGILAARIRKLSHLN